MFRRAVSSLLPPAHNEEDTYPAQARKGTGTTSLYATAQRGPFDKGGNSELMADPHKQPNVNRRYFLQRALRTTFQLGEIGASWDYNRSSFSLPAVHIIIKVYLQKLR